MHTNNSGYVKAVTAFNCVKVLLLIVISTFGFIISTQAKADSFSYETEPEIAIHDKQCVSSTVNVSDSFTVTDLNVGINLSHAYRSDLTISLVAPLENSVQLYTKYGSSADNLDISFDDSAPSPVSSSGSGPHAVSFPYYEHSYAPDTALSTFNGAAAAGSWVLSVCDSSSGDEGTVHRVRLTFEGDADSSGSSPATTSGNGPRSFSERHTGEFKGNFEYVGNTLLQCVTGCTTDNHNDSPMSYVDIDGDAATFNSSAATINLPDDAVVSWAGLYWGGTAGVNTSTWSEINPAPDINNKAKLKFKVPGSSYETLTANQIDTISNDPTSGWSAYQAFVEVTDLVKTAGAGQYTVADVQLDTGGGGSNSFTGPNGGWNLVVIYKSASEQYRRITIWDGYDFIYFSDNNKQFTIDSIRTPPAGSFETEIALTCYDGEVGDGSGSGDGDFIAIGDATQKLANGLNPETNVCNGTISKNGSNVSTRNPDLAQNWAFDVDRFKLNDTNIVPNDANSITAIFGSDNEGIWFGNIVLSTELFTPPVAVKSFAVEAMQSGTRTDMTIALTNQNVSGSLPDIAFTDSYPSGLKNAASAVITSNSCGGSLTASANAAHLSFSGGTLDAGESCSIVVSVVVDAASIGAVLENCTSEITASSTASKGERACASVEVIGTPRDFGDAPASYGDASHIITDGLYLGLTEPDAEDASQHSHNAYGDGQQVVDGSGTWYLSGDEDGAPSQPVLEHGTYIPLFPVLKMTAMDYSADFVVTNATGGSAKLLGWIDFDGNGTFEADEAASVVVGNGLNQSSVTLNWDVPVDIKLGTTFIRLRLTTDTAVTNNTPASEAENGEVEDFALAVAMDIPPDSDAITVISGETPLACQSVVFEDDFDDVSVNGSIFLAPNRGAGGGAVTTLRDWTVAGGGADTYARVHDASNLNIGGQILNMGIAIYLGNGAVRRISPAIGSGFTYDEQGRITNVIDAIELRDAADDSTPGSTQAGWGTAAHWGPEPVTLTRSFATKIGQTYRLYFKAIPEHPGGNFVPGAMRVDVPGGSVHFKIPGSDEGIINYAIEFTAADTSSALTFVNYGHVNSRSGLGWCDPASEYLNNPWCTVGGGDGAGNELIIDEVLVAESDCGLGSISGVVYRDSNKNDNYDSAAESGLDAITVTLHDDKGTPADKTDDELLETTSSAADGGYRFSNVSKSLSYRLEVDAEDVDLPERLLIGTANPITGIVLTAESDILNQNFGFDVVAGSCPAGFAAAEQPGYVTAVALDRGVGNEARTLGPLAVEGTEATGLVAAAVGRNDELIVDLGVVVPGGVALTISLARNGKSDRVAISSSADNTNYEAMGTYGKEGTLGDGEKKILDHIRVLVPEGGARYVSFVREAGLIWVDGVTYTSACQLAGSISGVVYHDANGNNTYDAGAETGLGSVAISVFKQVGGDIVALGDTANDGSYRFDNLSPEHKYRVLVDSADTELPAGAAIGTANPLTNIRVTADNVTADQNIGFDVIAPPDYTTVGEYRFDDCQGAGSWNLDASGNNNNVTGAADVIVEDFKDYGCTSVANTNGNMKIPHHPSYVMDNGAISILLYDHKEVWNSARLLEKGWADDKKLSLMVLSAGDGTSGTISATLNDNTINTGGVYFTTRNDGAENDTQWTHVVLTFGDNGMKLYINGELKGSNSYTGGITQVPGAIKLPEATGYFDELYILDGQPDDVEVQSLYNKLLDNKNLDNSDRTCACKTPYTNNYCVVATGSTVGLLELGSMATTAIDGAGSFSYPDRVLPGYGTVDVAVEMSGGKHNASSSAIDSGERQTAWLNQSLPSPGIAIYLEPDSSGNATVTYDFDQPTGNVDLLMLDLDYEDTVTLTALDGDGKQITNFSGWRYRSGDMSVWQDSDSEDALSPAWDAATATLSSTDSGDGHRSFGLLTPDTLVTKIVVSFSVPNTAGRHVYTALHSTLQGRDGETCATGAISGTVYTDANQDSLFNAETETGLGAVSVSLFNDDTDAVISITSTAADGTYQFTGLSPRLAYRLEVGKADPDLPVISVIATRNPLRGVMVVDGGVTAEQNFGFLTPLPPFGCEAQLYQIYGKAGQLTLLDLVNRTFVNTPNRAGYSVNASGYRQSNNLAYGIRTSNRNLVVVGRDGVFRDLGPIEGLLTSRSYWVGDFVGDYLYLRMSGGQMLFAVDVDERKVVETIPLSPAFADSVDMAYNAADGLIYSVAGDEKLYTMHPKTGETNYIGDTGLPNSTLGAQFMDANSAMFVVNNGNGNTYHVDIVTATTTLIGSAASPSSSNDGFSCASAVFEFFDRSDAPLSGTAPNGIDTVNYGSAKHAIDGKLKLGSVLDGDNAGIENSTATGDDEDALDDEDGVIIPGLKLERTVTVTAAVTGESGYLQAWIDWNGDGDFADAGEQIATDLQDNGIGSDATVGDGMISFDVPVPLTARIGSTFTRFRWSTIQGLNAVVAANNGEVEDYQVTIRPAVSDLSGMIFEDSRYGGGNGRPQNTAGALGAGGATIEIYDSQGNYVKTTVSASNGFYTLTGIEDGQFYVRVVSDTVSSARSGSDGSELGVMTYRTDGITDTRDEVGGRNPGVVDATLNDGSSSLDTNTFTFIDGPLAGKQAQVVQAVTMVGEDVSGVSFGFNFNTVVNTNADGQGSLYQFVNNSNLLDSSGVQQQLPALVAGDYQAGDAVAVFMIPADQLSSDQAVIHGMGELRISQSGTVIDGRVQSANIGSGEIVLKGDGGVMTNAIYYSEDAGTSILRDLEISHYGGSGIVIYGAGSTSDDGISVKQVVIHNNGGYGLLLQDRAAHNQIITNEIHDNGWAGIASEADSNNTFSQNSIHGNGGLGIDLNSDGVTENSNEDIWLNYPEVDAGSSVSSNGSRIVVYDFDLDVPANTHGYRVEFFSNQSVDLMGHGEGQTYLGYVDIDHLGRGVQNFKGSFNANQTVLENANIAIVLIEKTSEVTLGATSEFSGVRNSRLSVCTDLLTDSEGELASVTINENNSKVAYLEAKDADGNPITYVISGGADGGQFVINPIPPDALFDCLTVEFINEGDVIGTRDLSVIGGTRAAPPAPKPGNYEAPADSGRDNTYDLEITATDVNGNSVTRPISITVVNVNEKPVIISPSSVSFTERQEGMVIDIEAWDPDQGDAEGSGLTYSLSGGADSRLFTIDVHTGQLNFKAVPDFDSPSDSNADNQYEVTVRVADDQGYANTKTLTISVTDNPDSNGVVLKVRALLQGPFSEQEGLMSDALRIKGILPVHQPYDTEPFNYVGDETINLDLAAIEGENALVDWVLLEFRASSNPGKVLAAKAVLIQRDGDLMAADTGSVLIPVDGIGGGEYLVSLRHRNHLGVITRFPVTLAMNEVMVDFTTPVALVAGKNTRLSRSVGMENSEVMLLWSGDINQDQRLLINGEGTDLNMILSQVLTYSDNAGFNSSYQVPGYKAADLNMDGVTLFMGPDNDANVLLSNILVHPANEGFMSNYVVSGGLE